VHWALSQCDGVLSLQEIYEDHELIYLVLDLQTKGSLLDQICSEIEFTEC